MLMLHCASTVHLTNALELTGGAGHYLRLELESQGEPSVVIC